MIPQGVLFFIQGAAEFHPAPGLDVILQFRPGYERHGEGFRQQSFGDALAAHLECLFLDLLVKSLDVGQVVEHHQPVLGQVVEDGGRRGVHERYQKFIHFAGRFVIRGESVKQVFSRRRDGDLLDAAHRALGGWVELTQCVDLVAKELQPRRKGFGGSPNIEDAAALRELAVIQHHIHGLIAHVHPAAAQRFRVHLLVDAQNLAGEDEIPSRQGARHHRAQRSDHHTRLGELAAAWQMVLRQGAQGRQPVAARHRAPAGLFVE